MATIYKLAPEVASIGRALILQHHETLRRHSPRIEYLFVTPTPKKGGREVWGTARKISSLAAFLHGMAGEADEDEANQPFFCVVISADIWRHLKIEQKRALVDHELMHFDIETDEAGEPKLVIVGHDFEGFNAEIERHGMWRQDAQMLYDAMKSADPAQGTLSFEDDDSQETIADLDPLPSITVHRRVRGAAHVERDQQADAMARAEAALSEQAVR